MPREPSCRYVRTLYATAVILLGLFTLYSQGQSTSVGSSSSANDSLAQLGSGSISGDVYHHAELGFRYQFPHGWTVSDRADREKAVKGGQEFGWGDDVLPRQEGKVSRQCSKELLFVTQHPLGMRTNHFNPLALVIAADPKCAPAVQFPTTTQDREAVQPVAGQWGTFFKNANVFARTTARMRAFENAARITLEITQSFPLSAHTVGTTTVQNVNSSILIMPAHDYWVMSRFASGDEPQLEKLKTTKIFCDGRNGWTIRSEIAENGQQTHL